MSGEKTDCAVLMATAMGDVVEIVREACCKLVRALTIDLRKHE